MNTPYELTDPFRTENLSNNVTVSFYDLSRKIAGDRWLVRICCVATLPFSENLLDQCSNDGAEIEAFKDRYPQGLALEVFRERNFVDEQQKDAIVRELVDQLVECAISYMSSEAFPRKLLLNRMEEFKKERALGKAMERKDDIQEDDGPADFSACFRD